VWLREKKEKRQGIKLYAVCLERGPWEAREDEREPRSQLPWHHTDERPGEGTHGLEGGPEYSGSQIPCSLGS